MSRSRSRAITRWRSSLFLPDTRIASPWIWDLTFGNSSRISLVSFLAVSSARPAAERDHLLDGVAAGRLDLAPVEDLEAEVAPDRLRLDQVLDHLRPELVVGQQDDLGLLLLEVDLGALEVEALLDLASDLVEGVPKLLLVEIADHIERDVTGHEHAPSVSLRGIGRQWYPLRYPRSMRVTFLGQAGLFIETRAGSILCDPWFSPAYFGSLVPVPGQRRHRSGADRQPDVPVHLAPPPRPLRSGLAERPRLEGRHRPAARLPDRRPPPRAPRARLPALRRDRPTASRSSWPAGCG